MTLKFMIMVLFIFSSHLFANGNFDEKTFKKPVREISIIATENGFFPSKIMAFTGERIRFFVTSTTQKKQCFILQRHEVFLAADPGKVSEGAVDIDIPGRFKFYCPSSKFTGYLTVFEKFTNKNQVGEDGVGSGRSPASVKQRHWMPRDFD